MLSLLSDEKRRAARRHGLHYDDPQTKVEAARVARLRQRIEREAVFGERNHRMTRDEETFVLVALRHLARTLQGESYNG